METQTKTFSELRKIVARIHKSINDGYLPEYWKEYNEDEIVETDSGYYALMNNCVLIDETYWLHSDNDNDLYVMDEIDNEYIFMDDAIEVNNGKIYYWVHENKYRNGSNDIYKYNGEYVDDNYINRNNLVWAYEGGLYHVDDVYYWESDNEYHLDPEPNEGCIESYSFKPSPKYFITNNESFKDSPLFMGIELEIENEKNSISNGAMSEILDDSHLYFKTDGSLSDGFEIVTHPLTFEWIKENKSNFSQMLESIKNNGFRSYDSTTCGMHIHLSKKNFGAWHLYRFLKFFQENKEFIIAISQRKIDNLKRWANLEDETNDTLIYKAKRKDGNNSRYVAINLCNSQTIELRIFRGTLNENSFFKNIEFAHSVYVFSRDFNDMNLSNYKKFISDNSEYSHLSKFIKLKNL
jgi:hypothetical protein